METLRQWLARIVFAILLAAGIYLAVGNPFFPATTGSFSTGLSSLPSYTLMSLLRMSGAYLLALAFSLAYGSAAALRKGASRIMLPILDVLQSVPVLGFFPAAIFLFVTLVGRGRLGVEMASVFLIFTSQAWNMTFGVYESLTTIPKDIKEASRLLRVSGSLAARKLYLPTAVPKLVHNSVLSWAGGWYFLVASEIIAAGPARYQLPGIGSFLIITAERGQFARMASGLAVLIAIVVAMDVLLWRPIIVWSDKFKYEIAAGKVSGSRSLLLGLFNRFRSDPLVQPVIGVAVWPLKKVWDLGAWSAARLREGYGRRPTLQLLVGYVAKGLVFATLTAVAIVFWVAGRALWTVVSQPLPTEAYYIPAALGTSFLRLFAAYAISLLWVVPVSVAVGMSPRAARIMMPVFEVAASVPATALFPIIVVVVVAYTGSMNIAAILLVLTGMQWYLLFNLVGGISAIPEDLKEVARTLRLRGWMRWRRLILPAAFPSLITGSITAWGGGWNALIVAEYFRFGGKAFSAFGIGALLDEATYVTGDSRMILYSLAGMVLVIVLLNRIVWRRAYDFSVKRYRIEY